MKKPKRQKVLVFYDLKTKEVWEHPQNSWFLTYCNFNSSIHPMLLKVGQEITIPDANNNWVRVSCRWAA